MRQLGQGGAATVFEACHIATGERVAIKRNHTPCPTHRLRLRREYDVLEAITHDHVVRSRDLLCHDDVPHLVMELVEGTNLMAYVRDGVADADARTVFSGRAARPRRGRMEVSALSAAGLRRLRHVLPQVAHAIAAVHQAGWLHRDVKPTNILVTPRGRAVLLDIGLATPPGRIMPEDLVDGVVGTPVYMSPEQSWTQPLTPASDWYGLGVVIYQALVGAPPFAGPPTTLLLAKQDHEPVRPRDIVEGVPADLEELCMAMLAYDPADRPASETILRALTPHVRDQPTVRRSHHPAYGEQFAA